MEDYIANEVAAYPTLTNQVVLEAFQYLILLLVGSIALVTMSALLAALVGLVWQGLQSAPAGTSSPRTARFKPTTRRFAMKKIVTTTLLLCCALLAAAVAAHAQTQDRAVTNGPVCRISEYRIKPGKGQEHMKFLREHRVQILAEQKQQGLILDFKFFHNDATAGPQEVQFVEAVCYRNYNDALDSGSNEELVKKLRAIIEKHYGSLENANQGLKHSK